MKQSKRAGVSPRRPVADWQPWLSWKGGCSPPPPALLGHVEHEKNGRVEGALDRADEEDGKTRGSESTRGLHKEKSTVRMEKLVY